MVPRVGGTQAPEGAERTPVQIGDLAVDGIAVMPAVLPELKARLVDRAATVADIYAVARALEQHYAIQGRVLVRVIVPPQDLPPGATLRLTVVEGLIERVETGQLPAAQRGRIAQILAPLVGKRDLALHDLERRLLLAGDTPGMSLRSTLAAGAQPGGAVLAVEARWQPVHGFVTLDNSLPEALGRYALGLGVDINSPFGLGELLYLRAGGLPNTARARAFYDDRPRNRAIAGGLILPLGTDGLAFNIEGTDARTAPQPAITHPGFASHFQRLSARLRYPLIRRRAATLLLEVALEAQDERLSIIEPVPFDVSLDRLRIARLSGTLFAIPAGGSLSARAELSFGIDGLGARSAADATVLLPLSRQGADADLRKLEVDIGYDRFLGRHVQLAARFRAQTSFGAAMPNSEQLGIATLDGISPLGAGALQGDNGYAMRGELRAPLVERSWIQLTPFLFGAAGRVHYERPSAFERETTDARAYGLGLRGIVRPSADGPMLSGSLEYGRATVDSIPGHPDRFSFTVAAQF